MKRWRALTVFALSAPALAGAAEFRTGQPVMGTILQITVIAETVSAARHAADAGVIEARRWDDILTTWRPEGELAQLNAAAGGGDVVVSAELLQALRRMQVLNARTGGAFDPAVGSLVALWRQPQVIAAAAPSFGLPALPDAVRLGSTTARLAKGVALDAGAIGKGMALDAIADLLRGRGVQAAFLDFGGSSQLAIGVPPDAPSGWRMAVSGLDAGVMRGSFALQSGSLSTSRSSGPAALEGPIVDPRTRRPVSERRVVTVWNNRATEADAWSTALIVRGREGIDAAVHAGVEVFFEDAGGVVKTDGFKLEDR